MDLKVSQRKESNVKLMSYEETKFLLRRVVPRKPRTLWSHIITDIALGEADAKNENHDKKALRRLSYAESCLKSQLEWGATTETSTWLREQWVPSIR